MISDFSFCINAQGPVLNGFEPAIKCPTYNLLYSPTFVKCLSFSLCEYVGVFVLCLGAKNYYSKDLGL